MGNFSLSLNSEIPMIGWLVENSLKERHGSRIEGAESGQHGTQQIRSSRAPSPTQIAKAWRFAPLRNRTLNELPSRHGAK